MPIKICVFDAYGTLFDVGAAARTAAAEPGRTKLAEKATELAEFWRQKQLSYSWLRAVSGNHIDFWTVTENGLDWALERTGLDGDVELRERLLSLYWELAAYREVPMMLATLKAAGMKTAILSNGEPEMLEGAVKSAGLEIYLDAVLSVEDVGVFKPDPKVYQMVLDRFKCSADEVLFVSSNGWDAAAASGFGFQTAWVNRAGEPMDRLFAEPQHVLSDLTEIPKLAGL
ncbi:haloacid dehalogenase type II [Planktotalea sp.]|uniref:haloacid dehalogenase type II n=1 Tax=Planktotalea sp. TaxID=2029877 RepID=UPI003D6C2FF0